MAFFNPFDVVTSGAKAVPGMPGMGPSQEAINAGKVGGGPQQINPWGATPATPNAVQQGSLAALGGGPPMTGIDWDQHMIGTRPGEPGFDPNKGFNQILYPGGQLPPGWQPNTGGMNPNTPQPVPGMPPKQFDPNTPAWTPPKWGDPSTWQHLLDGGSEGPGGIGGHNDQPNWQPPWMQGNRGSGQPINQPFMQTPVNWNGPDSGTDMSGRSNQPGSLQSLGGGQLNQSGMVNLRGTDGTTKAVPQQDLAHWLSRGAVRV